jgi:hypothetical protein
MAGFMNGKSFRAFSKKAGRGNEPAGQRDRLQIGGDSEIAAKPYIVRVDSERFYKGHRFYWTICSVQEPDQLVCWGHAPTREMAETTAANEIERLTSRET